nr:DUF6496 domain-containing protein [Plastoroseomonas hellenica]
MDPGITGGGGAGSDASTQVNSAAVAAIQGRNQAGAKALTVKEKRSPSMAQQSRPQKETVGRVMHEFKHGELRIRGSGPKVKSRKQAIAVALHEAGATRQESRAKNKEALRRTKAKERRGQTAEAEKEGKRAQDRTMRRATARKGAARGAAGRTKQQLYAEAKRRNLQGRSTMSKAQLERALHH